MHELRNLWLSTLRLTAIFVVALLVTAAPAAPVLAQDSSVDPTGVSSSDPGSGATDADGEDEDIDEWENDILKSTASPTPDGWLPDLLASWIDAVRALLGASADAGTASK